MVILVAAGEKWSLVSLILSYTSTIQFDKKVLSSWSLALEKSVSSLSILIHAFCVFLISVDRGTQSSSAASLWPYLLVAELGSLSHLLL